MSSPHTKVEVGGKLVDGLLDTGATITLITNELINKEAMNQVQPYGKIVRDASNNVVPIIGELKVIAQTPAGSFQEKILIMDKKAKIKTKLLIGMNLLQRAEINIPKGRIKFNSVGLKKTREGEKYYKLKFVDEMIQGGSSLNKSFNQVEEEEVKDLNLHLTKDITIKANACMRCHIEAKVISEMKGDIMVNKSQIKKRDDTSSQYPHQSKRKRGKSRDNKYIEYRDYPHARHKNSHRNQYGTWTMG